jgi:hypothetical protein
MIIGPYTGPKLRRDCFDLPPGLERPLLFRPPRRVGDAERGRVVVEQSPADGAVEHLAQRLRRLEAVPLGDGHPPCVHVPWRQIRQSLLPQHLGRLSKQPAQLRDRHRRRLMHLQILLDELSESDRCASASWPEPVDDLAKRLLGFRPGSEPTDLRPL